MTDQALPETEAPLTPLAYVQESLSAWQEFNSRAAELWVEQISGVGASYAPGEPETLEAETLTNDFMRAVSDLNLRHWQNTARLIDNLPGWSKMPQVMAGSALTDWFDQIKRAQKTTAFTDMMPDLAGLMPKAPKAAAKPKAKKASKPKAKSPQPVMLKKPKGKADDLTRIKGVGPRLSDKLNDLGVYHFRQIADWNKAQATWVDDQVAGKGRIAREAWVSQARKFISNGSAPH